jgi:5'-nucleotidase
MTGENLHILLTNDDGFYAEGLQTLYSHLKTTARVTIIAPDHERSAVSHGITMHQPLRAFPVEMDGRKHWMINGTPADCIKLGLEHLLRVDLPALIISGINRGSNLGTDVLYSGTVSGAIEGALHRIPSIAASLVTFGKADFNHAAAFIGESLPKLTKLAAQATLNLNFPVTSEENETIHQENNLKLKPFKGVKFTKLGIRLYQNVFEERTDPRGQAYYWMSGEPVKMDQEPDSDITAIEAGFISVTPLNPDLTDRNFFEDNHDL